MPSDPRYLPSPAEIARECERIRAEWTAEEEAKRRVIRQQPAEFRVVKVPKVG